MGKQFVLAIVTANGTRWNVSMSDRKGLETFVAERGALAHCKGVGSDTPVEAIVYRPGCDEIEEAWFYEGCTERKLDLLTIEARDSKRGNW